MHYSETLVTLKHTQNFNLITLFLTQAKRGVQNKAIRFYMLGISLVTKVQKQK